jgi:hypothetical protein
MASNEVTRSKPETVKLPIAPIVAAWLIPGGGHFLQRRWGRGALLLVSLTALFLFGITMRGRLFAMTPGNIVESLGFAGDVCSGLLYMGAKFAGYNPGELPAPAADFGTKFILVAGLLNVLCILDAYDIAVGKKD